jgi:hypothetical protein
MVTPDEHARVHGFGGTPEEAALDMLAQAGRL